jgi:transposase
MGRRSKELSLDIKQLIVDLKENRHKVSDISRILDIPESTCKSILKVLHQRGSVERADRSGRPRKVSRCGEVRLLRMVRKNRGSVLKDITTDFNAGNHDARVSERTVKRILHKNRVYRRVVRKRMVVEEINRKKRLAWCLLKRRWSVEQNWKPVIFSDESREVLGQNNPVYVWRYAQESYYPEYTISKPKVSAMIWGCISWYQWRSFL